MSEPRAFGDRYKYTGREFDGKTGLQYNRARYYDPRVGRWTTPDPIGFHAGDSNLYVYVWNAPTAYVDPAGLFSVAGCLGGTVSGGVVGAVVGGVVGAPFAGIGALPGAIGGGVVGAVGGCVAGGLLTRPVLGGQSSSRKEFATGLVIGIPVGIASGIAAPLGIALAPKAVGWVITIVAAGGTAAAEHPEQTNEALEGILEATAAEVDSIGEYAVPEFHPDYEPPGMLSVR